MSTSGRNHKAEQMFAEANTLQNKWSFFNKEANMTDAAELFNKAANLFKASEEYDRAAEAYNRAYLLSTKLGDNSSANKAALNKALCLSKGAHPEDAIAPLENVVENYITNGSFSQAAKTEQEIAKLYESMKKYDKASEAYKTAAGHYEMDNRPASALPFKISAAKLDALSGQLLNAFETFDKIGMDALNSGALRFGAKEHFVNAIICQIANDDEIGAEKSVEKYKTIDPSISSERDYKTMSDIIESVKQMDAEKFKGVIAGYAQMKQVDEFRKQMFDIIKQKLEDNANAGLL
ncbi:hypothetical protein ENUP19_0308G0007 [Entamoeba nuttalli]|uniref:Alpha-soluble NSF attachment protein, putative n=2 Tax=Entamoeba nuttalli TaxID=412467 RepID=K2HGF3_ENTNP|nr:alpha-soluble NSF attachment protein, putative [Entamoeba nuttalli P19]EKE41974.1 alpha-soluble NSF attachment protein, putative [Entamoeba nuttalli P19]|eukprot:XP_008855690.1 alpha-soluble NSF attachment protein, putative [Entamoeba nuttalli P19]